MLADSIGAMRVELREAVKKYDTYRPHFTLSGKTPIEYIEPVSMEVQL